MAGGDSKHATTVDPTTTTAPVAVKTTTKGGCDVGSAVFDGGCCASTSIFKCDGTMYCADGCPAVKTITTTPSESAAASTTVSSAAASTTVPSTTSSSFPSSTSITSLSTSSTLATTKSTTKHTSTPGEAVWTITSNGAVQLTSSPSAAAAHTTGGLSTGVKAAIGVGSAVLFILLISVAISFCCMARRRKNGEKKKVVEVGVGSDWKRGGYSYKAAMPAVAGLARSASRKLRGYQHDLSGGRYGSNNHGGNYRNGPFPAQATYDEMPAVELSHPNMHGGAYGGMHSQRGGYGVQPGSTYGVQDTHDAENKKRLAAIRESIYGPM